MAWISAQRMAEKMYILKDKITEELDKEFLKIYMRNFAHELNVYFLKPWSYFFWTENAIDLEDALKRSGHGKLEIHSMPKRIEIKFILKITTDYF